jgi:pilus assembly protein Flp/PilA
MSFSLRSLGGRLLRPVRRLRAGESGQGLTEYALIIAIVSLGAIVSLTFLKGSVTGLFDKTSGKLAASTSPPLPPVISSAPSQPTTQRSAMFAYSSQFAKSFACKLDTNSWTPCSDTSQGYFGPLAVVEHRFQVRATNDFGTSEPAVYDWTILGSPPPPGTGVPIGNRTYYYYPAGVVQCALAGTFLAGLCGPTGLEGFYTVVAPQSPPTSFTVDGWTFACSWHTAVWTVNGGGGGGNYISACVHVLVPAGGTASLAPTPGPVTLGTQLTTTTSGWLGNPTSYEYRWQHNSSTDCASGPYTNWETNNTASSSNHETPNSLSEGNRCYRVLVTASNYGGDSVPAQTDPVFVQNPPAPSGGSVTITEGATATLNTTLHATTTWTSGNPTSYTFLWQQGSAGAPCASATFSGTWDSDTNSTPNDTIGNTPNSLSEGNRCYRVTVTAAGLGGSSAAPQPTATVFVQNPPQPPSGGSVTISNQGGGSASGADDGDMLRATTSGWDNHGSPITSYTYTWQRSDNFSTSGGGTCSNNNLGPAQGPTSTPSTTNDYATPDQGSGAADSIWVTVTATSGNGTSTSVTDCVVVYNDTPPAPTDNQPVDSSMTLVGGGTSAATIVGTHGGQWYSQDISGNGNAPDISGGAVMRDSGSPNPGTGSVCGFTLANGFAFTGKTWHVASSSSNDWNQPNNSNDYEYACY